MKAKIVNICYDIGKSFFKYKCSIFPTTSMYKTKLRVEVMTHPLFLARMTCHRVTVTVGTTITATEATTTTATTTKEGCIKEEATVVTATLTHQVATPSKVETRRTTGPSSLALEGTTLLIKASGKLE